jgi:hypothetical protein
MSCYAPFFEGAYQYFALDLDGCQEGQPDDQRYVHYAWLRDNLYDSIAP